MLVLTLELFGSLVFEHSPLTMKTRMLIDVDTGARCYYCFEKSLDSKVARLSLVDANISMTLEILT
jgi:hypothetical protein